MKRLLLFAFFMVFIAGLSAQKVVVQVNAPSAIAGGKIFTTAAFGADLTANVWTLDAACAVPNLACAALTNGAAVSGKIALIDRGTCNFDAKALNAQNAGAAAVIIMNHNDLNNRGGAPFPMGIATPATASQVTIPVVMVGYEDGLALKAACAAGVTINITLGAVPKGANDLAIYTNKLTNYNETYAFHPSWGAYPNPEIRADNDYIFQPGTFFRNEGTNTVNNININAKIKKGANTIYDKTTTDNISLEVDSISGLITDAFDFNSVPAADRMGRYDLSYNVIGEGTDPVQLDNTYNQYFNVTSNIICKSRFTTANKAPVAQQYWGGGTAYRELLSPFRLKYGKGATIDSMFFALASNEPLAGMYIEGKIYKVEDLNGDNDITNDELSTVAVGSFTFPNSATGSFGTVRLKLDDLIGDPNINRYTVESDEAFFFASVSYPGGANSFFNAYDVDYNQRQWFNLKDGLMELDLVDWPYISARTQDGVTGGPDLSTAGLFYVDDNGDGTAQDQEVAFFSPSLAVEINFAPVATKDIEGDLGVSIEVNPNPARDVLNVKFSMPEPTQVNYQIIGSNGNLIFSQDDRTNGKEFNTTFNVSHLPEGQYFLKVNTSKGFVKKAFTKVK